MFRKIQDKFYELDRRKKRLTLLIIATAVLSGLLLAVTTLKPCNRKSELTDVFEDRDSISIREKLSRTETSTFLTEEPCSAEMPEDNEMCRRPAPEPVSATDLPYECTTAPGQEDGALPFFLDPFRVFDLTGDIFEEFKDAIVRSDIEDAVAKGVSCILWLTLGIFTLILWVLLPVCCLLLTIRLLLTMLRLTWRCVPKNWRIIPACFREKKTTPEIREDRLAMKMFSKKEELRLMHEYIDAPVSSVDAPVPPERIPAFVEWCCSRAEEIFRDETYALKVIYNSLQNGWISSIRIFDAYMDDMKNISIYNTAVNWEEKYENLKERRIPKYEELQQVNPEDEPCTACFEADTGEHV